MVNLPNCLRFVRTEEGKKLRKAYESHQIHHKFNEFRSISVRSDNICNTITSVQKDTYILVGLEDPRCKNTK